MTENTGYFRIDEPPQQNPYPRIKSNSSQPNIYQQAPPYQPYANQAYQPYYNINQPPPPPYNAQGFNPNINHINEERLNVISEEAVLSKNATKIIWISLIVFIQDPIYAFIALKIFGFQWHYLFTIQIIQVIVAVILLSQIKNGKASTDDLKRSRSVLFGFSMVYFVIGLLMMLLMWFLESLSRNSGLQIATILFFTVGVVVFIIPRIFVYIKAKPIDILPMVVPYQHVLLP